MPDYAIPDDLSYGLELPLENLEYDDINHSIVIPFAASLRRDRIGDYLQVSGIQMENHRKNPVVFLDHARQNQPLPIGKTQSPSGEYTVWIEDDMAWAKIYLAVGMPGFPPPTPELVYELYKGGFLKGGSIGFRPLLAERLEPDPDDGFFKSAMWIKSCELQEISVCALPMNQDTVKSSLVNGILNGKPLTSSIKSLLIDTLPKTWSQGINIKMSEEKKSMAMSAVDQSVGGAMVAPPGSEDQTQKRKAGISQDNLGWWYVDAAGAEYGPYDTREDAEDTQSSRENKMNKATDTPDLPVKPVEDEDVKSDDAPDMDETMQACKDHLECAADHADTPDDLRASHAHFAKEIGDSLEDKGMKDDEEEEDIKDEDDAPHEDEEDLDLVKDVKEHLEDAAEHEDQTPVMKAAHMYHADQLDKCMKCMGKDDDMSEEEGAKILGFLARIGKRLTTTETKINRIGLRV